MTIIPNFIYGDDSDNFYLFGTPGDDQIVAFGGNDQVSTGYGNDTVYAGKGNDTVYNDGGDDYLDGGTGHDTISFYYHTDGNMFTSSNNSVIFDLAVTKQTILGWGTDEYHGFENVEGTMKSDLIFGNSHANHIDGEDGADLLMGRDGNDTVFGGAGADAIEGGKGRDVLAAGNIASSTDYERDVFRYNSVGESGPTSSTRDTLWGDFRSGGAQFDKIDLSKIDANSQQSGDQAFHSIGRHAFHAHARGELRIVHVSGDKYLVQVDTDSDASAEMSMVVHSTVGGGLHESDFIL